MLTLTGPSQGDSNSISYPLSSPFWSKLQASAGKPAFPHLSEAHGLYPGLAGPHSSQPLYVGIQKAAHYMGRFADECKTLGSPLPIAI